MGRFEEADELYAVPPEEFVSARTALARRLREEGRAEDAAEVAGLRKPPLSLWAVNELARSRAAGVETLLAAADRLRRGEDAGGELRRAHAELVRAAGELLERAGHAASDATLQRVAGTLHGAAAAGRDDAEALRRGALRKELEPAGFEAMAAFAGAAPRATGRGDGRRDQRRQDERRRARLEEAQAALEEARSRERELRREAGKAERAAERARRDADRAAAAVEKAERALARAREKS